MHAYPLQLFLEVDLKYFSFTFDYLSRKTEGAGPMMSWQPKTLIELDFEQCEPVPNPAIAL